MSSEERRYGTRKHLACTVMLANDTSHRLCTMSELSMSGAMLDIGWGALTHDTPVHVMFDLPEGDSVRSYKLTGVVARVSNAGIAIRFTALDADTQLALARALRVG